MSDPQPYLRANQELWDELTEINFRSAFYDVDGFKKQPKPLDDLVREGLGDVRGKRVLHLQCHFGMDTLRVAFAGAASVTGVDFSTRAIERARTLAADVGIAARFIHSNVYDLPSVLDEQFDLVFSSWGVLGWLPDLRRWAQVVARHVAPGGRFFLAEGHPTMWMFDETTEPLRVKYPYFSGDQPLEFPPSTGTYADATAVRTKAEYSWPHTFSEILNALIEAGLRIDAFHEHRHTVWKAFPFMIEEAPDRFVFPKDRLQIPLAFSLHASK
jgi:SAM-dependent methyltransferase